MARPTLAQRLDEYGAWPDVAASLELALDPLDAEDAARVPLLVDLARVVREHLGNPARAIELLEAAVELDITDAEAGDLLVSYYADAQEHQALVALQVDRLAETDGEFDRPGAWLSVVDAFAGPLAEPATALQTWSRALTQHPTDARLAQRGVTLAADADAADLVATALLGALESANAPTDARALRWALACVQAGPLQRPAVAQIQLEQLVSDDLADEEVLVMLQAIYEADEDDAGVLEVLNRRATALQATDSARAAQLYRQAAQRALDVLEDPALAAALFERARDAGDDDPALLEHLQTLYRAAGNTDAQQSTLLAMLETTEAAPARAALWAQVATLRGTGTSADDAWRAAFEADPSRPDATAAVLALAERTHDTALYREAIDAALERDPSQFPLWVASARLFESIDDDGNAHHAWSQALALGDADDVAFQGLLALYERAQNDVAVRTLWESRAADASRDATSRAQAWRQVAHLHEERFEDPDAALLALEHAAGLVGPTPDDLRDLARRYEATGQPERAATLLGQLAHHDADADARRQALESLANLHEAQDDDAFLDAVAELLSLAPDQPALRDRQVAFLRRKDRHAEVVLALLDAAESERDLVRRAARLAEAAIVRLDELGDVGGSRSLLESAIELDPGCIPAAGLLVDLYVGEEAWERALPLLRVLLADAHAADPPLDDETRAALHLNLAVAADRLDVAGEATTHYEAVVALQPDNPRARRALVRLWPSGGRADDALRLAERILDEEGMLLPPDQQIELGLAAAKLHADADASHAARLRLDEVLQIDPYQPDALALMARITLDGATLPAAERAQAARRVLAVTTAPLERFDLLVKIGDALAEDEDNIGAVEAFRLALEIDGNSRVVLHKLLNLFMVDEQWRRAAEVLGRLHTLEQDPTKQQRLLFTLAALLRDQLEDFDEATRFFEMVLDSDPERLDAFEAIVRMLQGAQRWSALERAYRRMIERAATGTAALQERLLTGLARIYEERLHQPDEAIAAWKLVAALRPDDVAPLVRIAVLEPSAGKDDEVRIEQHRAVLALAPDHVDSWHALYDVHLRRREFDAAWRIAQGLRVLGAAQPDQLAFFEQLRPERMTTTRKSMAEADWAHIQHAGLDFLLTRLFTVVGQAVAPAYAQPPRALGLDPEQDRLDMTADHPLTTLVVYAMRTVGLPTLETYLSPQPVGIANPNFWPPACLVGDDILQSAVSRRLAFRIGRGVTLLRPEFYLASAFPSPEALKTFVYGALAVYTGQVIGDPSVEAVQGCAELIRRQPEAVLTPIGQVVNGFLASGTPIDISQWLRSVELTASRVGLLLCGDLERAIEAIREEGPGLGRTPVEDRIRDLVLYSMTPAFEDLRGGLGLAVGQG